VQRAVHAAQGYVEVCDEVGTETSHVVTWQLAPGWRIEQEQKNGFVCKHAESIPVHATLNGDHIEQWEIVEREASPHFRELVSIADREDHLQRHADDDLAQGGLMGRLI
jgi:hypothetical protein